MMFQFGEFELFEEAFRGLDLEFRQLEKGAFRATMNSIETAGVILSQSTLNRRIEQNGITPKGLWTIGIPAVQSFEMRWRSKPVDWGFLMFFRPGEEIDCISNSNFRAISVTLPASKLNQAARKHGVSSIEEMIGNTSLLRSNNLHLNLLRRTASKLLESAISQPNLLQERSFRISLEQDFIETLLDTIESSKPHHPRPMAHIRSQALHMALEIIRERSFEPISVSELHDLTGASSRTLRYGFMEHFGVSPKQYLLSYRLNKVRRALLKKSPKRDRIADIANEWGFWHLGEFAAQYRRQFGELPSHSRNKVI